MNKRLMLLDLSLIFLILSVGAIVTDNFSSEANAGAVSDAAESTSESQSGVSNVMTNIATNGINNEKQDEVSDMSSGSSEIPAISSDSSGSSSSSGSGRSSKENKISETGHEKTPITAKAREENKKKFDFTGTVKVYDGDKLVIKQVYFEGTPLASNSLGGLEGLSEITPLIGIVDRCMKIRFPGDYYLINNIQSDGTCIEIAVPDVTLDCNGYSIFYAQAGTGRGIESASDRTTIEHCLINQFRGDYSDPANPADYSGGIYISNSQDSIIRNNRIETHGFQSYGIKVDSLYNSLIKENPIATSGEESHGILIRLGSNNEISGNEVLSFGTLSDAIKIHDSLNNKISRNKAIATGDENTAAFTISGSSNNNLFESNTVSVMSELAFKIASNSGSENTLKNNLIGNINLEQLKVVQRTDDTKLNLINQPIEMYDLSKEGIMLKVAKDNAGEINFLSLVSGAGESLSDDIKIDSNLAKVESEKAGLNSSALVTLSDLPGIPNPIILRNGFACPSSVCTLHGEITDEANFEVNSWSEYSIGQGTQLEIFEELTLIKKADGGCLTDWTCTEWSACAANEEGQSAQTRTCQSQEDYCYNPNSKPAEVQACTGTQELAEQAQLGLLARITGAVIGFGREAPALVILIFLGLIGGLYILVAVARRKFAKRR